MAIFRKIHTSFWGDSFSQDLTPEQKFFFLYLLTNERTKQCGIYDIGKRQMCFDTGYNIDTVSKHLQHFISIGKIRYNSDTSEIAIKNWLKYNDSTSPKVQSCINKELMQVKDESLIEYVYCMDRVSILDRKKNKNKNKNKGGAVTTATDFSFPELSEVKAYFLENGYPSDKAEKAFSYYQSAGWVDGKGNKVLNWKQKMQSVWFKPEELLEKQDEIPKGTVIPGTKWQKGMVM